MAEAEILRIPMGTTECTFAQCNCRSFEPAAPGAAMAPLPCDNCLHSKLWHFNGVLPPDPSKASPVLSPPPPLPLPATNAEDLAPAPPPLSLPDSEALPPPPPPPPSAPSTPQHAFKRKETWLLSVCMCMYVCMDVCVCVCIYIYMHSSVHVCMLA